MTSPKTPSGAKMLPYRRQGEIDYANLEFDPNEKNVTPDAMEQTSNWRKSLASSAPVLPISTSAPMCFWTMKPSSAMTRAT